jgi:hypothetical protein
LAREPGARRKADVSTNLGADLIVAAYVLSELPDDTARSAAVSRLSHLELSHLELPHLELS